MKNQPYATPPTGIWAVMAPVKGRIAGAIALAALSAITSLGSLLAVPLIAAELLSDAPEPVLIGRWIGIGGGGLHLARSCLLRVSHGGIQAGSDFANRTD